LFYGKMFSSQPVTADLENTLMILTWFALFIYIYIYI